MEPRLAKPRRKREEATALVAGPESRRAGRKSGAPPHADLLGCLSEFLAARNVINRTERYEKLGRRRAPPNCFECPHLRAKWLLASRPTSGCARPEAAGFRRAEHVKKFEQCDRCDRRAKLGIRQLLADLLSGRRGNRLVALLRLLRAPVVLAALFSLALAVSLITLYTISFHHCQTRLGQRAAPPAAPVNGTDSETEARLVTVHTECGPYQGRPEGGALQFRGVAFASPPVGARRWQKPRPVWQDEPLCRRGSHWREQAAREHCVQLSPYDHRLSGAEDCLYLDVYTPARLNRSGHTEERLPVMVYIHGGFLVSGSNGAGAGRAANWISARPSGQLASALGAVLVAPNYRLQALGFMALRQLALDNGPDGSEGNYGLWDQLIALQWIKRNIGAFGGDAANVLLFGPDAASALPLALVSRKRRPPAAANRECAGCRAADSDAEPGRLFHSVWLMNPTVYYELPYELANQHYARLVKSQSACSSDVDLADGEPPARTPRPASRQESRLAEWRDTRHLRRAAANSTRLLDCLLGLPAEQVAREYLGRDDAAFRLDDENSLPIRNIFPDQFVTLDGELVRDSFPFAPAGEPRAPVDFTIGSTAQAVGFWPCPRNLAGWSWADFRHYVATSLNSFSQADETLRRAAELYGLPAAECAAGRSAACAPGPAAAPAASPAEAYLTMVSDIRQVCPARELGASLRAAGSVRSLEHYVVEWRPSAKLAASLAAAGHNASFPQLAFHYWDLLALFGFEFEPGLAPDESDLEFQRHIRALARRLARAGPSGTAGPNGERKRPAGHQADRLTVFTRDHRAESAETYKRRECKMWQQSLKQSYAWIS